MKETYYVGQEVEILDEQDNEVLAKVLEVTESEVTFGFNNRVEKLPIEEDSLNPIQVRLEEDNQVVTHFYIGNSNFTYQLTSKQLHEAIFNYAHNDKLDFNKLNTNIKGQVFKVVK